MRRRDILKGAASVAALGGIGLGRPAIAQGAAKTLRFVPQANLANPDPIWTTATVAINHGYMVFDTLYGIDDAVESQPQMCAGHEVSSDELTWTFTLRDGLLFHDNETVRAIDCTTSLTRWAAKDPFGQQLVSLTEEMKPLDDRRFEIRLKKPFRQMLYALGARNCFMMPERMASTPRVRADQGIHRLRAVSLPDERMGVRRERGLGEVREIRAAAGEAVVFLRRQGRELRPGRMDRAARPRHIGGRPADRRGRLGGAAADRPRADAEDGGRRAGQGVRPVRLARRAGVQPPLPAVRQSEAAARDPAGGGPADLRADRSSASRPIWGAIRSASSPTARRWPTRPGSKFCRPRATWRWPGSSSRKSGYNGEPCPADVAHRSAGARADRRR